jgi:Tol biopolymer transport system component
VTCSGRVSAILVSLVLAGCAGQTSAEQQSATSHTPSSNADSQSWLVAAWYPDQLYLVHPDGTNYHALDLDVPGVPFAPSWSVDGKALVFVVWSDVEAGSIWTADVDGTHPRELLDSQDGCPQGAFWPVWSPDGSRLAIVCYHPQGDLAGAVSAISVLDPQDGSVTELVGVDYPSTIDNPPSWSPDGTRLAFEVLRWDSTDTRVEASYVATTKASGGGVRRLTDEAMFAAHPSWSPDGSTIVFNTYDTGNIHGITEASNLYSMRPDGSDLHQLTTASVNGRLRLGQPFWAPDGSRIWVSIAEDWEKDSQGQFKNTLGWVDPVSGALQVVGSEGKRWVEQPTLSDP